MLASRLSVGGGEDSATAEFLNPFSFFHFFLCVGCGPEGEDAVGIGV